MKQLSKFIYTQLVAVLFFNLGYSQLKPNQVKFESHKIKTSNDTIEFFLRKPKSGKMKHLILHVSGSYPAPLWLETKPCCLSTDPFSYDIIPDDFAYVVISKYGFPFSDKEEFEIPKNYWNKNTLDFRVERTNRVINYIREHIFKPQKLVLVGTSQGTDVLAKIATINSHITHLGFWVGGGLPQLMEFIMFVRKDVISGKISEIEGIDKINALLAQFEKMFADPSPKKMWDENSYLSYVSFSEPPVKNLLKLDIPIYVAVGTKDENVAIENSYIIPIEFIRHRKKNLTFKQLANYDHNFFEILPNGEQVDRFDKVSQDFFDWVEEN